MTKRPSQVTTKAQKNGEAKWGTARLCIGHPSQLPAQGVEEITLDPPLHGSVLDQPWRRSKEQ